MLSRQQFKGYLNGNTAAPPTHDLKVRTQQHTGRGSQHQTMAGVTPSGDHSAMLVRHAQSVSIAAMKRLSKDVASIHLAQTLWLLEVLR